MFRLIPAPLHRAGVQLAYQLRKRWWRLARPRLKGVTLVARNAQGEVLLVRHTYGSPAWTLPGGGIRLAEAPEAAARREFFEELGCAIEELEEAGTHKLVLDGARITRHIFVCIVAGSPEPDGREVAEAKFFSTNALPRQCSAIVDKYLEISEQR